MFSPSQSSTSEYRSRQAFGSRGVAFVTTSLAVYLIISLFWPASVSRFRSLATIDLTVKRDLQPEHLLPVLVQCVREESSDVKLKALIEQVQQSLALRSRSLEYQDFETIVKSLQVGIEPTDQRQRFRFTVGLDGTGFADEQQLVELLVQRVAQRARTVTTEINATGNLVARVPAESDLDKIERALWIANQIETDLQEVARRQPEGKGQFQLASSAKRVDSGAPNRDLSAALKSIDTRSLRDVLQDVHRSIQNPDDSKVVTVDEIRAVSTTAVNATPGRLSFVLMLLLSGIVGIGVAVHYQPFAAKGFQSPEALANRLGVPLVATLPKQSSGRRSEDSAENSESREWANLVVEVAGLVLLGAAVIVIGFMIIDPMVRDAFFQNPYDGLARMIRVFVGY